MKASLVNMPGSPSLVKWAGLKNELPPGSSFEQYLGQALGEVNRLQQEAEQAAAKLAAGEIEDVQQAVLAAEKAMLSLQLALQLRNKVLEAYQEIIRMSV
ncbi:MAG: flagellar hook-basal body complex protein FliE [Syntrophomonadaceae bacterium]|nr:flagellar hook-basal body complex protein FliE [Syntrophomonadaceae bacterium]